MTIFKILLKPSEMFISSHDQTVRYMNSGFNGAEIAEKLLPAALDQKLYAHGYYGT